jgi:sugar lactone lactonase YvrE
VLNCNAGYPPGVEVRSVTSETLTAEPFVSGLFFGECPRWHEGRLWYSDFFDHAVFSVSPDGERRVEVAFDGEPAGLGWLPDGRLLINSRLDRVILRREPDGTLVEHGDLRPWATWHANDMVVASNGQAYSGNFGFDLDGLHDGTTDASAISTASLIRVDPDGTSHEAAGDFQFPNGTVITEDGATLIIAESLGGRLSAFDRAADGSLGNRREWASLKHVAPDGICLCADGSVWVANALGAECLRVAEGGDILERVTTSRSCFACMLGDDDRRTLYLVTAADSNASVARAARNGALEKVRTNIPGAGLP